MVRKRLDRFSNVCPDDERDRANMSCPRRVAQDGIAPFVHVYCGAILAKKFDVLPKKLIAQVVQSTADEGYIFQGMPVE